MRIKNDSARGVPGSTCALPRRAIVYNRIMVQDQLIEYVSSQLKLGVSREAVKSALVAAGWAAADVEDTLKKIEGAVKPAQPGTQPTQPAAGGGSSSASIKVSDLLSASGAALPLAKSVSKTEPPAKPLDLSKNKPALTAARSPAASSPTMGMAGGTKSHGGRSGLVRTVAGGIVILALGGLAGYLYIQNNNLTAKVASLGATSSDVAARLASLGAQVQALNASNTALAAQTASLAAENNELKANLSFSVVPAKAGPPATVLVSGRLGGGGKSSFTLATPYGVLVYVQNSKDAKVAAALAPLLASTSSVALTGMHVPGSQYMSVTAVNGSAIQ